MGCCSRGARPQERASPRHVVRARRGAHVCYVLALALAQARPFPPFSAEEVVSGQARHSITLRRSRRASCRPIPFRVLAYRASGHARSVK